MRVERKNKSIAIVPIDIKCFCDLERHGPEREEMVRVLRNFLRVGLNQALQIYKTKVTSAQKQAATKTAELHRKGLRKQLYSKRIDHSPYIMLGDEPKRLKIEGLQKLIDDFDPNALQGPRLPPTRIKPPSTEHITTHHNHNHNRFSPSTS